MTRVELTVTVIQQMPEATRRFEIEIDGEQSLHEIKGHGTRTLAVAAQIPAGKSFAVTVRCSHFFVPMELELGPDVRELAYLLERIMIE